MLIDPLIRGLTYLGSHPLLPLRAARNAARLEVSLPIDLLRWAIDKRPRGKGPTRIELQPADPALGLLLAVDLYGTELTITTKITIERIELVNGALEVALRVRDLDVQAPPGSPAAMMIQSMDLTKPGNLVKMMPQKHRVLVSATDDLFVLDLFQIPALSKNERLRQALSALSFIRVGGTRADGDLLALALDVRPTQIPAALGRAVSG
jgi:hypothetical protein